jgi:hypothetical protein
MKLPHGDQAPIHPSKRSDYLLSLSHPVGRSKAQFFRSLGCDETSVQLLEQGLLPIAETEEITTLVASPHGRKYTIEGRLQTQTPTRRVIAVRTVWIIENGQQAPRFVTAYPF